jgi:hypothetical protein
MAIVDEPRAVIVMRRRRKEFTSKGAKWSLTDYYRTKDFYHKSYLNRLCPSYRKRLINIPSGFAFVNEANAICMRSLLGEVVIVSECLENFYYFMTLAFMGGDLNIPTHDRLNALLIAFRIMNGAESLDFEIDPRGNLPIEIEEKIQGYVRSQMEFTYGHEYSHYLLGHLNNSNLKPMAMFDATDKSVIGEFAVHSHELEFQADLKAVQLVERNKSASLELAWGAFSVFVLLHFLIKAELNLGLRKFSVSTTHPSPIERVWSLQKRLGKKSPYSDQSLKASLDSADGLLDVFQKYIANQQVTFRSDILSFYGSVYLPSYKKKMLRDRIDF